MYKVSYHNLTGCTTVHKTLGEVFERITESVDFENEFNDVIDDEDVVIFDTHYRKSHLLKEADPEAYERHKYDYIDVGASINEIRNDLESKGYSEKYGFMITEM